MAVQVGWRCLLRGPANFDPWVGKLAAGGTKPRSKPALDLEVNQSADGAESHQSDC